MGIVVRSDALRLIVSFLFLCLGAYFSWEELFDELADGHPLDHYSMTMWAALLLVRAFAEALHRSKTLLEAGVSLGKTGRSRIFPRIRDVVVSIAKNRMLDAAIGFLLLVVGVAEMASSGRSFWHAGMALHGLITLVHGTQSLAIGISEFHSHHIVRGARTATRWSAAALILFGFLGSISHWFISWLSGDFSLAVQADLGPHHGMLALGLAALKSKMVPLFIQVNYLSHLEASPEAGR